MNSTNSINQISLTNSTNPINCLRLRWYALYTHSRHEKFVEDKLIEKGVKAFTPTATLRKKWSDRVKHIEVPLFKSYCFAKFLLKDKVRVISQKGVVKVVNFNGQYVPVEDSVVNSLKILTESKIKLDFYPHLKIGDKARVKKGPLEGVEGIIIEKRNKNAALVVSVYAINASIKCIVDIDCVESTS